MPSQHSSADGDLPSDALFELLRNERRREVIHHLRDQGGSVALRELSERIAAVENDCAPSEVDYQQRKRVQTALYQVHLPKLTDWGIVSYDQRAGQVELGARADDCLPYLAAAGERDHRRWQRRYLLVAAVLAVPVTLAAFGVRPFAAVPGLGYATLVCVAFAITSLVQVVQGRP